MGREVDQGGGGRGGGGGSKASENLNLSPGRAAIRLPEAHAEGQKQPDHRTVRAQKV